MDKCLNDDPTHTLYEWDLYLILFLLIKKASFLEKSGGIYTFFVILHNDNPYELVSSNSPDYIKVIVDLHPRYSLYGHFGW